MSAPAAEPDLRLILDNIPGLFGLLNAEGRLQFRPDVGEGAITRPTRVSLSPSP